MRIHVKFDRGYRKIDDRTAEINQKASAIVHRFDTAVETLEVSVGFCNERFEVFE